MLNFMGFMVRHSNMYKLVSEQMFSFEEYKSHIDVGEFNLFVHIYDFDE